MNQKTIRIPFAGAPNGSVLLSEGTFLTPTGFGTQWRIYPTVIVPARYRGTYEGAPWLCFPTSAEGLCGDFWSEWNTSDVECAIFWDKAREENWPIGYGGNPSGAYADLIERCCRLGGVA